MAKQYIANKETLEVYEVKQEMLIVVEKMTNNRMDSEIIVNTLLIDIRAEIISTPDDRQHEIFQESIQL